ncbi:hypothetical protein I3842_05G092300 [Carya illinoinensis]|uniref:Uncharacterized protein n=1 Tax=Carya illinoinensis TaxID=32201 RepID=A0A922EYX7_CARIL|nr:hypothetical protein I3842_05G092300 [Carya illinoinensis]
MMQLGLYWFSQKTNKEINSVALFPLSLPPPVTHRRKLVDRLSSHRNKALTGAKLNSHGEPRSDEDLMEKKPTHKHSEINYIIRFSSFLSIYFFFQLCKDRD